MHKQIIEQTKSEYESSPDNIALLVTGSVARDEQTENSDLDILLVSLTKQPFEEKVIDGITVEIKTNTIDGFIEKMQIDPMNVYQWLDASVLFDKQDVASEIISEAKDIYENYKPDPKEISGVKKWLESSKTKIEAAQKTNDELSLGFNVSNILWTIIRGLYLLNNKPVPPSTTAFRRIKDLEKLPTAFEKLWEELLTGDLDTRSRATLSVLSSVISLLPSA